MKIHPECSRCSNNMTLIGPDTWACDVCDNEEDLEREAGRLRKELARLRGEHRALEKLEALHRRVEGAKEKKLRAERDEVREQARELEEKGKTLTLLLEKFSNSSGHWHDQYKEACTERDEARRFYRNTQALFNEAVCKYEEGKRQLNEATDKRDEIIAERDKTRQELAAIREAIAILTGR